MRGPVEEFGRPAVFSFGGLTLDLGYEGADLVEQLRGQRVVDGVVDWQLDVDALNRLHGRGYLTDLRVRELRQRLMRRMVHRSR